MKPLLACVLLLAVLAPVAPGAGLPPLRSPQVPFQWVPLQNYLEPEFTYRGDGGIRVLSQQRDVPTWSVDMLNDYEFSLLLVQNNGSAVGFYDTGEPNPTPFEVFPAGAPAGSYAAVHCDYSTGDAVVSRFDPVSNFLGQSSYPDFHPHGFGFYVQGACGARYSEDSRNVPAGPQALVFPQLDYDGFYDEWAAFASCPYDPGTSTFMDVLLNVQLVLVVPAHKSTWGQVKAQYH
jgi:hypothetical protein